MQDFIAEDGISKEILNSAKLLQAVQVNALILGSSGTGKKSLAKYILPNSDIYEAKNLQLHVLFSIHGCYLYFYFDFDLSLAETTTNFSLCKWALLFYFLPRVRSVQNKQCRFTCIY